MVLLVGEQPIPNLISIRYYRPERVTWVYTQRTEPVVRRLQRLVDAAQGECKTDAYDITRIQNDLRQALLGGGPAATCFNLTGGTKPMGYAAYELARELRAPIVYLQSEGEPVLYEYRIGDEGALAVTRRAMTEGLIDIDAYLRAHVGDYQRNPDRSRHLQDGPFVDAVAKVLRGFLDEVLTQVYLGPAVEIDVVCRWRNTVGIAELKTGRTAQTKEGINQLATATRREYLGIYTRRLLITDRELGSNLLDLATAQGITVVPLPSWRTTEGTALSTTDQERLRAAVARAMGLPAL